MAIVIARTSNSSYVIEPAKNRVDRHGPDGRRTSSLEVSSILIAQPLDELAGNEEQEDVIRGPQGQALVLLPAVAWRPVVGLRMVLHDRSGGSIVTTPVLSVTSEDEALAA